MFHKHIQLQTRLSSLLIILFCGAFSTATFADNDNVQDISQDNAQDDTQQAIHIEADQAELLEQQGIMTYTGHVLLKQGGIEVKANTVVVYTKDGDLQRVTAEGQPVSYFQKGSSEEQQANNGTKDIKGKSQRMEYNTKDKRVLLLGNAEFWQGDNHFSGHRIEYDPNTQRVIANANTAGTTSDQNTQQPTSQQRVTVTLQPKKKSAAQTDKPQSGISKPDSSKP